MFNPLDLAGAIADAVVRLIQLNRVDKWARLVFTMAFSGSVGFLGVCGGALVSHRPALEAIGSGMGAAAIVMTVLFRRSELTKGMLVALPAEEAAQEIKADIQVISK